MKTRQVMSIVIYKGQSLHGNRLYLNFKRFFFSIRIENGNINVNFGIRFV